MSLGWGGNKAADLCKNIQLPEAPSKYNIYHSENAIQKAKKICCLHKLLPQNPDRPGREVKWCMLQWESGILCVSEPHHKYCSAVQRCQIYTSFVLRYKTIGIQPLSNSLHVLEPILSDPAISLRAKQHFASLLM